MQELFSLMSREHGIILLETEAQEIIKNVEKYLNSKIESGAQVPCSAGLESRFNMSDNIVEEAAMELDTILGDYVDMTEITKPGTYSKVIRSWIAETLNKAL